MKKIIKVLTVFLIITIFSSIGISKLEINQVRAACPTGYTCYNGCEYQGQCVNNKTCSLIAPKTLGHSRSAPNCGSAVIGGIEPPQGVATYNFQAQGAAGGVSIGILVFASKLLKLVNIAAGLLFFANFTMAGYAYITSAGNTNIMTEIKDKLTFSIIGIIIIVAAYTGAALFGYIFFGDPGIVLNPDLTKYGALAPPTP